MPKPVNEIKFYILEFCKFNIDRKTFFFSRSLRYLFAYFNFLNVKAFLLNQRNKKHLIPSFFLKGIANHQKSLKAFSKLIKQVLIQTLLVQNTNKQRFATFNIENYSDYLST